MDCGQTRNPGLPAELSSSGGSRAANADGAPRKHGPSIAGDEEIAKPAHWRNRLARWSKLRKNIGRRRQAFARKAAIVIHLADQRLDRVEFHFLAQEGDEGDIQAAPIEIALEIEQKYLKERRAIVEGRAAAKTGHAVKAPLALADPHRVDAMFEPAIPVEPDIGGGITEIAAAFIAMDDLAGDKPRAAQHRGRLLDLSLGERHADGAGRDRAFLDVDMRLDIDFDAEPRRLSDK